MALINYLTRIHFADRVLEDALAEEIRSLGMQRPLIVTDVSDCANGPLARVTDAMPRGCKPAVLRVRSGITNERSAADIRAVLVEENCDGYIGLGSETVLNLARCAAHEGHAALEKTSAAQPVRPRMIAIPTSTACIGVKPILSESGRGVVRRKLTDSAMLPDTVLCDPTLTLGQSERATAEAGMGVLSHCIEAYLGNTWNPPADGMALDGIRRAKASLESAVHCSHDLDARREMMAAALEAGLAAQKGLGAVEALSHALAEESAVSVVYGHLHAALLPVVLAFNAPAINGRFAAVREALQVSKDEEVGHVLLALGASINLPSNLEELRLDDAIRGKVARRASEHPASRTNPRYATTADYIRMLEHAS